MLQKRGIALWEIFLVFVVCFHTNSAQNVSRNNFPKGFVFGTASSAYHASSIWLYLVPHGIRSLMNYIKEKYGNPLIIITENGMDDSNNALISRKAALKDTKRVNYHNDYLTNLLAAIKEDGCNVKGYFVWSLMDNWEMGSWIFVEVWSLLCGLQGQPQEISQGFRELVQEFLKLCLN